jgi:hypothetical protein
VSHFDWVAFCRAHQIKFVTTGPNVARGDINIRCPMCGDDPSEHMGLSKDPRRPWWSCWRSSEHRGRDPVRLIMVLLRCSQETAQATVEAGDFSAIDRYEGIAGKLTAGPEIGATRAPPAPAAPLRLPREFKPVVDSGYGSQFYDYLRQERGFDHVPGLVDRYDLRYCVSGHFRWRIVIPIYLDGQLVSWTARDITGKSQVRYRTLSDDPVKAADQGYPPALINLKSTVLNVDFATGGDFLFVCEGPFDAIKLDWYAGESGTAVAVFGMPEMQQAATLRRLSLVYRRLLVTLDKDAKSKAMKFVEQLRGICSVPVSWLPLPGGVKDPGELTRAGVGNLCRTLGKISVLRSPKSGVNISGPVLAGLTRE